MIRLPLFLLLALILAQPRDGWSQEVAPNTEATPSRGTLLLVVGAAGTPEFGTLFQDWSARWQQLAMLGNLDVIQVGHEKHEQSDRDMLRDVLQKQSTEAAHPLWLVLIGHGTFDGKNSKFNLRGDDVTAEELQLWLATTKRPLAIIAACSSSGQLIEALSGSQRVIISSTKNAAEVNFARFGGYFTTAIGDPAADLDKDEQVSLLEAFLKASRQTRDFYEADGRLETEHSLLDDNGDGLGTRSSAFQGVRAVAAPEQAGATLDGLRAHQWHLLPSTSERQLSPEQVAKRDALEEQIETLRARRQELTEEAYYAELEILLVRLAELLVGQPK